MHQHLIVIHVYILFKFPEIRFRGYLVIANYMDFISIQRLELLNYQGRQPNLTCISALQ